MNNCTVGLSAKRKRDSFFLLVNTKLQTVHVRVNDAATGKPTPCRVRFTDAAGNYYAPLGRLVDFALGPNCDVGGNVQIGDKKYAYIDGTCEIDLPPGRILAEISKGPEYTPLADTIDLAPGKLALRFVLERWINLRERGWYAGDTRAHCLSPHAALLEAQAEDIAVVNLLIQQMPVMDMDGSTPGSESSSLRDRRTANAFPNILAFSGQKPILEAPGHLVAVNSHNVHPALGSLGLLHCHRLVFPLTSGQIDELGDWTLDDWCDQCHRKNGLVVWTNLGHGTDDFAFGEPLAALLLGKIDALEIDEVHLDPVMLARMALVFQCLHFPLALVGASAKDRNQKVLGRMRTFARLLPSAEFSYSNWIEAVRAGRTFVTNGPLLDLEIDGHGPGSIVPLATGKESFWVRAEAKSLAPFDLLELLKNNDVVESVTPSGYPSVARMEGEYKANDTVNLAIRCVGNNSLPTRPFPQPLLAQTTPIQVRRENRPLAITHEAGRRLEKPLADLLQWIQDKATATPKQRERAAAIVQAAIDTLRKRADS
ncbi:MAG: hypothetical protein L0215_10005 [Gemmataceae bacterium]|nr:hypothetical protein [Gemmataceae bacterium]